MVVLYVVSAFTLLIILGLYICELFKILNSKYLLFKTYKINNVFIVMVIFLFVIITLLSLLGWEQKDYAVFWCYLAQIILILGYISFYFIDIKILNKKAHKIVDFKTIDFKKMIEWCELDISKNKIKSKLENKNNTYPSLSKNYFLINEKITTMKQEMSNQLIADAIIFNESNIKIFNIKHNKIVYKLSLYLFWDIKNKLTTN